MGPETIQRMKPSSAHRWYALIALAGTFLVTDIMAQQVLSSANYPDKRVKMTVRSVFSEIPQGGYLPVIVEIENNDPQAYSFQFSFSSKSGYGNGGSFGSSFGLTAEAGKNAVGMYMVPLVTDTSSSGYSNSNLNVSVSAGGLPNQGGRMDSNMDGSYPCVALSTESNRLDWNTVKNKISSSSRSGTFGSSFEPKDLPTSWQGYTGFDALVISRAEWAMVPPTARKAMLDWVRSGGRAVFWDKTESPTMEKLGLQDVDLGLGEIILSGSSKTGNPVKSDELEGRSKLADQIGSEYQSGWPLQKEMGVRDFKVGQIVLILIVFAILVGPVNLFVWAKPGKRHRLFFTTPIISIAASLLLAGLIMVQDGFGGNGVRSVLTLLDGENNQAITTQEQLARTGVLLSRSFETEEAVLISPVAMAESRWTFIHSDYNPSSTTYASSGSSMSGDFFRSRSEQGHLIKTITPTRAGIEQSGKADDGSPMIISSIVQSLGRVVYVDPVGKVWQADGVKTGAKVTMKPWDEPSARVWWMESISHCNQTLSKQAKEMFGAKKRVGRFFAVAEDLKGEGSFAVETLGSVDWDTTYAVYVGKMKNAKSWPNIPTPEEAP